MGLTAEGRLSDSPYVDSIWRGCADADHTLMCPADGRWTLSFSKLNGMTQVAIEGPMTKAVPKTHLEGVDWLVIKFKLGVFLPGVPARKYLDSIAPLPEAACQSFWFDSLTWQIPNYENADTFVDRLVRAGILVHEPITNADHQGQSQALSLRTVQYRFLRSTGLSQRTIRQIERARYAAALLKQGVSIFDTVYKAGYSDQPHLTRSLKHFIGYTPAEILTTPIIGLHPHQESFVR